MTNNLFFKGNGFKLIKTNKGLIKTEITDENYKYPKNSLYEDKKEVEKHFKTQRVEFEHYAKNILDFIPIKKGNLLDIGCGFGWVVSLANAKGFKAKGIDQSKAYTSFGKKTLHVDLQNISLEKFKTTEKFDVIILNHVLEHIADPKFFLEKIATLLKPDGQLFIASPNIDSAMFMLFKSKWYGLQPYQHVWQFTPDSLERLVEVHGFKSIKMLTPSLDYNVKGPKGLFFIFLTWAAPYLRLGDQVFILCEKNHAKS